MKKDIVNAHDTTRCGQILKLRQIKSHKENTIKHFQIKILVEKSLICSLYDYFKRWRLISQFSDSN